MNRTDERPAGGIPTGLSESNAATKRHILGRQCTASDSSVIATDGTDAPATSAYAWQLTDRVIAFNHRTVDQVVRRLLHPPRQPRSRQIRQTDDWPPITMPGRRQQTAA